MSENHKTAPFGTRHYESLTITVPEAARLLGIGRNTAYAAANSGQLPTIRIGKRMLVSRAALETMVSSPTPRGYAGAYGS